MSLLRIWLTASAVLLGCAMIWAFAPILVPLFLVTLGLGGLVTLIVRAARAYERSRSRRSAPD